MKKEQRYILDWETRGISKNGEKYYNPDLSGEHVKDKALFFKPKKKYLNEVYEQDWVFDYLEPIMLTKSVPITHICDFHRWIRSSPD